MEEIIIEKYNNNVSIESLCKEFKVGKLKIRQILLNNNVTIKSKGGQIKHKVVGKIKLNYNNLILSCKCCGKEYDDVENKSGGVTNHIKKCYPNEIIPSSFKRRMYLNDTGEYWHFNYFNLKTKSIPKSIKCLECNWSTVDVKNISGALSKHIENHHVSISEYVLKFPTELNLFTTLSNTIDRNTLFNDSDNYITCELCGEQFKTISNTHLTLHNITTEDYKNKFGENSLISKKTKDEFVSNLLKCDTNFYYRSKSEKEIEEFIKSLGVNINICDKKQLNGIELDLFLPDYNVAIEYNGLYWHSENRGKHKNYHIDKTLKCLEKNIQLIHIFSDEWLRKKDIIKNRIINLLKINKTKIYARNCKISTLTNEEKSYFLNHNHLQGNDKSSIYFGLKYNDEIVSVISFGSLRKILGNKVKTNDEYELYRYCSNNVIGGFTKLLKYFIKEYSPKKIITYSNRNWSPSNDFCFYSKVGFKFIGETKPNYSYTKKYDVREHRFNYRKDKLVKLGYDKNKSESQIMSELGYDKIWDTGNLKYEILL
jgi:hypothetical protein